MPPDEIEAALVARAREGDVDAYNQLVERYQGLVYNLALRMLGDVAAAEDVAQEAFLSAYRNLRGLRGANFRSWLLRIAANGCRDQLRSARRRPADSLERALMADPTVEPPDQAAGPPDLAERRELALVLEAALATLPPDQRLAVFLSDVQGFDYEEIAHITGSALGTVKSRLSRGRERLRDWLRRQGELLPAVYRLPREEGR